MHVRYVYIHVHLGQDLSFRDTELNNDILQEGCQLLLMQMCRYVIFRPIIQKNTTMLPFDNVNSQVLLLQYIPFFHAKNKILLSQQCQTTT